MKLPSPEIKFISDRIAILPENFTVALGNRRITVLAGFKTDGASIPKALWWFGTPFQGLTLPAAVVHDALYQAEFYPRDICDEIFRDLLKANGVSAFKVKAYYMAVSLFGGAVWKKHSRKSIAEASRFVRVEWAETLKGANPCAV